MYFIVESKEGKLDIVSNFEDVKHMMVNIVKLMNQRDTKFYIKEEDIKEDGICCVKVNETKFRVMKRKMYQDGYIFSGYVENEMLYELDVLYYSDECSVNKELCQNIKVCNHTQKQKRIGSLEKLITNRKKP